MATPAATGPQVTTDVVVIGAGPAGYVCAIRLAQLGKKVTVIESAEVGGVCLNRGCIPSKALIHAGNIVDRTKHASELGISVSGVKVDMPQLQRWKEGVVKKLTGGVGSLLKANGCQVMAGRARFRSATELEVEGAGGKREIVRFAQCVIATGSRPAELPGFAVNQKTIVDSTGALQLQKIPGSLVCIGGGYIGLELGTFYAKMGTEVTVVEAGPQLLGGVDPELARVVQKNLEKRGVRVWLGAQVQGAAEATRTGVRVSVKQSSGKVEKVDADVALVTIGRKPNHEDLGLETIGVKRDAKGFIEVSPERRTSVPTIYAIGDVAGQPLLAHKGSKEGLVAAEAIAGARGARFDVVAMPAVIFTDPEIATVGLTESEARARGLDVQVGVFPFAANGRALSVGETDGFVKMLGDRKSGRLLGVHIVGPEASNLISEAALALEMGARVEDVALTVHPHPTLPETLMEAAEATLGHAIHIFQKKPSLSAPAARAGV